MRRTKEILNKINELKTKFSDSLYQEYLNGDLKREDLKKILSCDDYLLRVYFKEYNLKTRSDLIKESINHKFFDIIDSEIKAYLLGFYFADGNLSDKNIITISINENDVEIIRFFKNYISKYSSINYSKSRVNRKTGYTSRPMIRLSFKSDHMAKTLYKYNMGQRKTNNIINDLNFIPDDLKIHFIRGYFDGDGTVYSNLIIKSFLVKSGEKHISKSRNYNWSIISHKKDHLVILNKFISEHYNIYTNIIKENKGNYLLIINRKDDFFRFREILYNNSNFYLKRKKIKYMEIPC